MDFGGFSFAELASLLGLGSLFSAAVGSVLKWFFDRKARLNEIFMKTFERFSGLTAEYYVPMAVEGGRSGRLLVQLSAPKPPEPEFVFYTLCRFMMYINRYVQSGGGYLMRDPKSERIQVNLWFRARVQMPFTETDTAVMQDIAEDCNKYTLFKKKLEKPDAKNELEIKLKDAYDRYVQWIEEHPKRVQSSGRYLQYYRDYVMKNITDMYSGWYKKTTLSDAAKTAVERIKEQIEKSERKAKHIMEAMAKKEEKNKSRRKKQSSK